MNAASLKRSATAEERFHSRIASWDGCWQWDAPNKGTGYGEFRHKGVRHLAHRFSFETFKGAIPKDRQVDHECRNRGCVNPSHLRLLTLAQNVLCGDGITAKNKRKTHCNNGHEFTPENTYHYGGARGCKKCRNAASLASMRSLKVVDAACAVCGQPIGEKTRPSKAVTCSQSCAVKLSHKTKPDRQHAPRKPYKLCGAPANAKELCGKHYMAAKRRGEIA